MACSPSFALCAHSSLCFPNKLWLIARYTQVLHQMLHCSNVACQWFIFFCILHFYNFLLFSWATQSVCLSKKHVYIQQSVLNCILFRSEFHRGESIIDAGFTLVFCMTLFKDTAVSPSLSRWMICRLTEQPQPPLKCHHSHTAWPLPYIMIIYEDHVVCMWLTNSCIGVCSHLELKYISDNKIRGRQH